MSNPSSKLCRVQRYVFPFCESGELVCSGPHGAEWMDAEVTGFLVPPSGGRKGGEVRGESPETGGLAVHDTMAAELAKQRRQEMMREVERNRLARTARGPRKRSLSGPVSSLVWELKRAAARLRKLLRHPKRGRG